MIRSSELVELIRIYEPQVDGNIIQSAYEFATEAHKGQLRFSKDPYISHPVAVACILTQLKMDSRTIIAGLLHDTLEDSEVTYDDIEQFFGQDVADLVDGVTKFDKIDFQNHELYAAENFSKLVLALSKDIRVLIVKLADRLHNMRTLFYMPDPAKRYLIAIETMEVYAPLAERIGFYHFRDELGDLALQHAHPDEYNLIKDKLHRLYLKSERTIDHITKELKETLDQSSIEYVIRGRLKSVSSIWSKLQRKKIHFEQLSDIMAFRIIVDSVHECYRVLGLLHQRFPLISNLFKDYISVPKTNHYQSLHTVLLIPGLDRIEVQIRSYNMHHIAEHGSASSWKYKLDYSNHRKYSWIQELLSMMKNAETPEIFLELTKIKLRKSKEIFCFTPYGQMVALHDGNTAMDFVSALYSDISEKICTLKINGCLESLDTTLKDGDIVEIIGPSEKKIKLIDNSAEANLERDRLKGKVLFASKCLEQHLRFDMKIIHSLQKTLSLDTDIFGLLGAGRLALNEIFPLYMEKIDSQIDSQNNTCFYFQEESLVEVINCIRETHNELILIKKEDNGYMVKLEYRDASVKNFVSYLDHNNIAYKINHGFT